MARWILIFFTIVASSYASFSVCAQQVNNMFLKSIGERAKLGDAESQNDLGFMYDSGWTVPVDDVEAVKWYRKAADQGHVKAQSRLGSMYRNGEGVPKNATEAVKWYRRAAEQGYAAAQYNLGIMYGNGEIIPKNYIKTYSWFTLSAAQGNKLAKLNKPKLATVMTQEQIAKAEQLAAACLASNYKNCD